MVLLQPRPLRLHRVVPGAPLVVDPILADALAVLLQAGDGRRDVRHHPVRLDLVAVRVRLVPQLEGVEFRPFRCIRPLQRGRDAVAVAGELGGHHAVRLERGAVQDELVLRAVILLRRWAVFLPGRAVFLWGRTLAVVADGVTFGCHLPAGFGELELVLLGGGSVLHRPGLAVLLVLHRHRLLRVVPLEPGDLGPSQRREGGPGRIGPRLRVDLVVFHRDNAPHAPVHIRVLLRGVVAVAVLLRPPVEFIEVVRLLAVRCP